MPSPDRPVSSAKAPAPAAKADVLAFDCPHCGKTLKAKPSHAGRGTACPKCGEKLTVPAAGSVSDEPVADEPAADEPIAEFPPVIRTGPVVRTGPANPEPAGDDAAPVERASSRSRRGRRKKDAADRSKTLPLAIGGAALAVALLAAGAFFLWPGDDAATGGAGGPGVLAAIDAQSVDEGEELEVPLVVAGPFHEWVDPQGARGGTHRIVVQDGPEGARLNRSGSVLTWTPGETDGSQTFPVTVELAHRATGEVAETATFEIAVAEHDAPPWVAEMAAIVVGPGESTTLKVSAEDPDTPPRPLTYRLEGDVPDGVTVDGAGTITFALPEDAAEVDAEFAVRVAETREGGGEGASTVAPVRLTVMSKDAPARKPADPDPVPAPAVAMIDPTTPDPVMSEQTPAEPVPAEPEPIPMPEPTSVAAATPEPAPVPEASPVPLNDNEAEYESQFVAPLLGLYGEPDDRRRPLLSPKSFPEVRSLFAKEFARSHADQIAKGFGDKAEELLAWLDERPDYRETLFNAFEPGDNVAAGLAVFRQLYDEFGDDLAGYGGLTTAAAVVWDDPKGGPYSYDHHAKRAKATLPTEERPDALANVKYFIERAAVMQGRAQRLPWELQVLMVDHQTPLDERDWALNVYGNVRNQFGQCYSQVPYDDRMLETNSREAELNDLPYTLPMILEKGGVCAHQADYAARVGKSLGVPAMYVRGDGKFGGDGHAWVMWVDVTRVTDSGLNFTLESHGRYQDDHYYVGYLSDPQTGEDTTDRDLMRRLHAVATDRDAARHATLLMRAYPVVADRGGAEGGELTFDARLDYLDAVNQIDPWNGPSWRERAKLASDHADSLTKDQSRRLKKDMTKLLRDFAPFPDFTREVFAGISSYEADPKKRLELRKELLDLYAAAGRPDLSFEALPGYVDGLVEDGRTPEAVATIVAALMKYAEEGQYVPAALDRLGELAAERPGDLAMFYTQFLPQIPPTRGNSPSEYAIAMHKRAIEAAQAAGRDDLASAFTERMRAIGEGKLKSPPKKANG